MWYTCTSMCQNLKAEDSAILHQLIFKLSKEGWRLRTPARGVFDDLSYQSAIVSSGVASVFLPEPYYRGYNSDTSKNLHVFSNFEHEDQARALKQKKLFLKNTNRNTSQSQILSSLIMSIIGFKSESKSKFILTYNPKENSEALKNNLDFNKDNEMLMLADKNRVPVFNLASPPHKERILNFLCLGKDTL